MKRWGARTRMRMRVVARYHGVRARSFTSPAGELRKGVNMKEKLKYIPFITCMILAAAIGYKEGGWMWLFSAPIITFAFALSVHYTKYKIIKGDWF